MRRFFKYLCPANKSANTHRYTFLFLFLFLFCVLCFGYLWTVFGQFLFLPRPAWNLIKSLCLCEAFQFHFLFTLCDNFYASTSLLYLFVSGVLLLVFVPSEEQKCGPSINVAWGALPVSCERISLSWQSQKPNAESRKSWKKAASQGSKDFWVAKQEAQTLKLPEAGLLLSLWPTTECRSPDSSAPLLRQDLSDWPIIICPTSEHLVTCCGGFNYPSPRPLAPQIFIKFINVRATYEGKPKDKECCKTNGKTERKIQL